MLPSALVQTRAARPLRRIQKGDPLDSRLTPSQPFPEDLTSLDLPAVEVLNSKVERELDHEHVTDGETHPETDFRHEELDEELDRRDADSTSDQQPEQQSGQQSDEQESRNTASS